MKNLETFKDFLLKVHSALNLSQRTIYRNNKTPYLTRFYIYRKNFKFLPSLYLHCFHESDDDLDLHNHPWNRSVSFILHGSYKEEYMDNNGVIRSRIVKPGMFNYVTANKFHRIELKTDKVWTLFLSGRKNQSWGFIKRDTKEFIDHCAYQQMKEINCFFKDFDLANN